METKINETNSASENIDELNVFLQDIDDQTVAVNKISLKENSEDITIDDALNDTTIISVNSSIKENETNENVNENVFDGIVVDGKVDKDDNSINLGPEHFEMLSVIGKGAFGRVVLVRNRGNQVVYAMKIISKAQLEKKNNVSYMKSERDILTKIDFPFIVNLRFSFQSVEKLFLVMDYLQGGELFFHLMKKGLILENTTRFYMTEIILAIEHLHSKGIIHRDLKPENVLLAADGHICLTDFGLAKEVTPEEDAEGKSRTICGTNEYMAPEMITKKGYGKAVDWWSLGALMFEMSTGNPPFRSKNGKELNRKILTERIKLPNWLSADAHSLLRGLLERNVEKRLGATKSTMFEIGGVTALKQHSFFKAIDWNIVFEKGLEPPIIPQIETDNDTSNFCDEFTGLNVSESLLEVEDKPGTHSETYPGFSFICPSIEWNTMVFPDRSKMDDEVSNVSSTGKKKKERAGKRKRKKKKNIAADQAMKAKEMEEKENLSQTGLKDLEIISLPSSTDPSRSSTPQILLDHHADSLGADLELKSTENVSTVVDEKKDTQLEINQDSSEARNIVDNGLEKTVYIPPSVRRMREKQEEGINGINQVPLSQVSENPLTPAEIKYKQYLQALRKSESSSSISSSINEQPSMISSEKESWRSLLKSNRPPNPNRPSAYQPLKKEPDDRMKECSPTLKQERKQPSTLANILKQNHGTNFHPVNQVSENLSSSTIPTPKHFESKCSFPSLGQSVPEKGVVTNFDEKRKSSESPDNLSKDKAPSFLEKPKGVWGSGKPSLNYNAKPFVPVGK